MTGAPLAQLRLPLIVRSLLVISEPQPLAVVYFTNPPFSTVMTMIRPLTILLLAMLLPIAAAGVEDKGKLLAIVNGVSVYEADVFFLEELNKLDEHGRNEYVKMNIDPIVEQELLYQEAMERDIKNTEEYRRRAGNEENNTVNRRVNGIIWLFEKENERLKRVRDPMIVPDVAVDPLATVRWFLDDHTPVADIIKRVRHELLAQRYEKERLKWLIDTITRFPVSVNDVVIDEEILRTAAALWGDKKTEKPKEGEMAPLWELFLKAADIDPAGVLELEGEALAEFRTKLAKSTMRVGERTYPLSDLTQFAVLINRQSTRFIFKYPIIPFQAIKRSVFYNAAMEDGIGESPEQQAMLEHYLTYGPKPRTSRGLSPDRRLAIGTLMHQNANIKQYQITLQEITEFYEKNKAKFNPDLDDDELRQKIVRHLQRQRARGSRAKLLKELTKKSTIEIFHN